MKLVALCAVLLSAAAAVSAVEWVEPAFVESAATAKLRGVSHTVSPHRGMVTYISPARHVQTQGIVLTPPPAVSVVSAQLPRPVPQVLVQPVVVAGGLADAYDALHAVPRFAGYPYDGLYDGVYDGVPTQVERDLEYAHGRMYGSHVHHGAGAGAHVHAGVPLEHVHAHGHEHAHVHGHHHHLPALDAHVDVHATHAPHHHHASYHPVFPAHAHAHLHVQQALALEEPEYTGYNPAPIVAPVEVHLPLPHVPEEPHTVTYTVPRVVRTYGTK